MIWALTACHGSNSDAADSAASNELTFTNVNNYAYDAALDMSVQPTPAHTDNDIDWSGLTTDLTGNAVDPLGVTRVTIAWLVNLSYAEAEYQLVRGSVLQENILAAFDAYPEAETSAGLSTFTFETQQMSAEYLTPGDGIWAVFVFGGDPETVWMLAFMEPQDGAAQRPVYLATETSTLAFEATLGQPVLTVDSGPWSLDWDSVDVAGNNEDFPEAQVDLVEVLRFDDLGSDELADNFLDAERLATGRWTAPTTSTTSLPDVAWAEDADGVPFTGFYQGTTWVVALRCGSCATPAPPFVAEVQVVP